MLGLALDIDGHAAYGSLSSTVGWLQPLVGQSEEEVGHVVQSGTEIDNLGINRLNLKEPSEPKIKNYTLKETW